MKKINKCITVALALACAACFIQGVAFAAIHEVAAGSSIASAIAKASAGDTIRIAPGTYKETLTVAKPGLTITSATTPGKEPDVVVESAQSPLLTDSHNTTWRGIAFKSLAKEGLTANFSGFKGKVEYCRFNPGEENPGKTSIVTSGTGVFQGTLFANQNGGPGVQVLSGTPQFTYCRFENLATSAVQVKSDSPRFLNCLFVRNGSVLDREPGAKDIEFANCIFFLNTSAELVKGTNSPGVTMSNCLYTPARNSHENFRVVGSLEDEKGVKLDNCRTGSPRFVRLRRRAVMNLGIDDTRCIPLWSKIANEANKYGYPTTIAVHTTRLTKAQTEMLRTGLTKGHEVGTHGVSHAPLNLAGGLMASYSVPGTKSAYLALGKQGQDEILKAYINDKLALELKLGSIASDDLLSLQNVSERLRKTGVKAELTDESYKDVPAIFLTETPRFDLLFKNFSPTLGLQTSEYMKYEIDRSKWILEQRLQPMKVSIITMVYPYTSYSHEIAKLTQQAGYQCARGGNDSETFSPYMDGFDPYRIYGDSLKNQIRPSNLAADKTREIVYTILDYANDEGAVFALYSHAEDELTLANWAVLFKAIHDDGIAKPMTLANITTAVKKYGKLKNGRYFLPVPQDASDYHLRKDSPLRAAGKPVGLTHDFEGNPLPSGNPSIGLYQ